MRGHSVFSSPPQRPMTSDFEGFSIPDFIHYIYFPILILDLLDLLFDQHYHYCVVSVQDHLGHSCLNLCYVRKLLLLFHFWVSLNALLYCFPRLCSCFLIPSRLASSSTACCLSFACCCIVHSSLVTCCALISSILSLFSQTSFSRLLIYSL